MPVFRDATTRVPPRKIIFQSSPAASLSLLRSLPATGEFRSQAVSQTTPLLRTFRLPALYGFRLAEIIPSVQSSLCSSNRSHLALFFSLSRSQCTAPLFPPPP